MRSILLFFLVFIYSLISFGQNDTIKVKNGNVLYGEIKSLRSGVLTMETPYSDSDFTIEFNRVTELSVERICFLILTNGRKRTGYIRSESPGLFTFTPLEKGEEIEIFHIDELTLLDEISSKIWNRFKGYIDLSFNLTKANNASQFTVAGGLNYRSPLWVGDLTISSLESRQDNTEDIDRTDIALELQRMLPGKLYMLANISFLSNTEQALDSRYNIRAGVGRYLALTSKLSWGVNVGLNYNIESFTDDTPSKESTELYLGSKVNLFDVKDFSLLSYIDVFPSISESQRWRIDYSLDLKYDLPLDFYIKMNFQFNYDNQAAEAGSNFDYVFTTGVGWEFN